MRPKNSYPLTWPQGWKRSTSRQWNSTWKGTLSKYLDHLLDEIRRLGGRDLIVSTNVEVRLDGLPYSDRKAPSDPGVAVYFERKGKQMCFACDKYNRIELNVHAIGLTIEALRQIERCGASDMLERAFLGFAALPEQATGSWREILGFVGAQHISEQLLQSRFRELAQKYHPDTPHGDEEKFRQIVTARDYARTELGF